MATRRSENRIARPLKRILVAVDGSRASRRALREAIRIARATGAGITITHSVTWEPPGPGRERGTIREIAREFDSAGERVLKSMSSEAAGSGLEVHLQLLHGPAGKAVLKAATAGGYDLVVLGRHGRNAISRLLMGSVADRVARTCDRPVLLVP